MILFHFVLLMVVATTAFIITSCNFELAGAQPTSNTSSQNETESTSNTFTQTDSNLLLPAQPLKENIAQNGSARISLPFANSQPPSANWTYIVDSLPRGTVQSVVEEGDEIPSGLVVYRAPTNYIGTDSFSYRIENGTASTAPAMIEIETYTPKAIISDSNIRIAVSVVIAIGSVIGIVFIASYIIARLKDHRGSNPINSSRFWDIIRSNDMDPSLSVFQFFLWTIVLMFVLFSTYLMRIFGGVFEAIPEPTPVYLLALTGISFATPFASSIISSIRYPKTDSSEMDGSSDSGISGTSGSQKVRPPLGEMLREFGKPSLSRFQMFGWTWISIGIYLILFYAEVVQNSTHVENLNIPDVYPILVALMGLSEVVFLGAKASVTSQIEITKVFPLQVKRGQYLSIFGLNFGNETQDIWLGTHRIKSDDRDQDGNRLLSWSDKRIDIKVPNIPDNLLAQSYEIMVVKDGSSKIAFKRGKKMDVKIL